MDYLENETKDVNLQDANTLCLVRLSRKFNFFSIKNSGFFGRKYVDSFKSDDLRDANDQRRY